MIQFSLSSNEEIIEVKLKGDLDIDSTEVIEQELIPMLMNYRSVKVNLAEVPFVDSSGMGLLMFMVQTLNEKEIDVSIANVRPEVMDVFEILQIPEILGMKVFV